MSTIAPDIAPGYPSGGVRIGPAWHDLWQRLDGGDWHGWLDLTTTVSEAHGIKPKTVETLLYAAARAGLIEKRVERHASGVRAWVRRP